MLNYEQTLDFFGVPFSVVMVVTEPVK